MPDLLQQIADTLPVEDTLRGTDTLLSTEHITSAVTDSINKIEWVATVERIIDMPREQIIATVAIWAATLIAKILLALLVWFVGRWLIKRIRRGFHRIMERRHVDASLQAFLSSSISFAAYIILIAIIISTLGFKTTSFLALFGAAGVAIGLALSGTMQNFAGGIMLLLFKPFRVGDYIEAQGFGGTVRRVDLTSTVITTPDNKVVMLPNGPVFTGPINNFSHESTRMVEWIFGIGYGDSYDKAKALISSYLEADKRVLKDPAYFIAIKALADNSVNIVVRAWVNCGDYWGVFFDMNETVYKGFDKAGLNIPFPQMDVHLHNADKE